MTGPVLVEALEALWDRSVEAGRGGEFRRESEKTRRKDRTMIGSVKAARKRLFGKRVVGLWPREVRANVRAGTSPERDTSWPRGFVATNLVAAALVEATDGEES